MILPLFMAALGASVALKRAPKTKVKKQKAFGPISGLEYEVEFFPELRSAVVRLQNRGSAAIRKGADNKWWLVSSRGSQEAIRTIQKDFDVQIDKKPEPETLSV